MRNVLRRQPRFGIATAAVIALCGVGRLHTLKETLGRMTFVGNSFRMAGQPRAKSITMRALKPGDSVMVVGLVSKGWPTSKIAVSMLRSLGYKVWAVVGKSSDVEMLSEGVEGYVFGAGEPLPAVDGLVIADEVPLKPEVITAFVRRLSDSGQLSRVALMSRPVIDNFEQANVALKAACDSAGIEWTLVHVGSLRGGGPATKSPHCTDDRVYGVWEGLLGTGTLEEESFDLTDRGLQVGDVTPIVFGPFSTKVAPTSRLLAASALAESLCLDEAAGKTIGVSSKKEDESSAKSFVFQTPTAAEWATAFRSLANGK